MSWAVRISDNAEESIQGLPAKVRQQISRSIGQLEQHPFQGDVKAFQGEAWKGFYRKRAGDYRIIFFPHARERFVDVAAVLRRSEKTYA